MVALDDIRARVALSVCPFFDFSGSGTITFDDWQLGTSILRISDTDQVVWSKLLKTFASDEVEGGVDVDRLPERIGMSFGDPTLLHHVIKGLMSSVASLSLNSDESAAKLAQQSAQIEALQQQNAELAEAIGGVRAWSTQTVESKKARTIRSVWRAVWRRRHAVLVRRGRILAWPGLAMWSPARHGDSEECREAGRGRE